jgi:glycosyltransferase involved in cell wall biosynthesis
VRRNAETLAAAGYAVDVVCLRNLGEAAYEVIGGVAVHRLPLEARRAGLLGYLYEYAAFFLLALVKVAWLHVRHPYAVVEADSMPDFLVFAGFLPRLMGARLILYLFESMPEMWAQRRGVAMSHWTIRLLCWHERISCGLAHAVICCHDMARRALVQRGIPKRKVTAILNVPEEQVFRPERCANSVEGNFFRLVQHGTITENYGIQVVLQALKRLDPALSIHFDIVGDGEYRPTLEVLARNLGLQDRVTFHGFVSRERLLELLCRADVGIVPMLFEYQSPNKMFEFVALGKPVIASDRQTFRQHFNEGEILYFRTGDAQDLATIIERAIRYPEMTQGYVQRAAERYANYRWSRMRERYLDVYRGLITERPAEQ